MISFDNLLTCIFFHFPEAKLVEMFDSYVADSSYPEGVWHFTKLFKGQKNFKAIFLAFR